MNTRVSINNATKASFNERLVKKTAKVVLDGEEKLVGPATRAELSVAFVAPSRIRELNKKYRRQDAVTDVLSFAENGGCDCDCVGFGEYAAAPVYLGELAVCLAQVKLDARESKVSTDRELAWVVVHGILHLLGYDHETSQPTRFGCAPKRNFIFQN